MPAERLITQPLLEIRLKGSQAQMGAQYGEIMASQGGYDALLEFYPRMAETLLVTGLPRRMRKGPLRQVAAQLVRHAVNTMSKNRFPHFAERAAAMARAAKISSEMAKHLLVMDVFQNSIGILGRLGVLDVFDKPALHALGACTSAVVFDSCSADGELMHARNFDFPGVSVWERFPTIVYCNPDHGIPYGYLAARGADVPGVTAFNAEGISITFHTRFHRDVDFNAVCAVDLGHEIISRARTVNDAIDIAGRLKIASTWGIVVASAKEKSAALIETTNKKMRVIWAHDGHLGNTNHYQHPDMVPGEIATSNGWTSYTVDRLRLLDRFFATMQAKGGATLEDMQAFLGTDFEVDDPSTPRMMGSLVGHVMSVQSVVFKLASGIVSFSVGEAPTGFGPYLTHSINWSGDPLRVVDLTKERLSTVAAHYGSSAALSAYRHFQKAYLDDFACAPLEAVREGINQAAASAPHDPSLHFVAGILALEAHDNESAYHHLLETAKKDKSPYRKGQALLWASRAAAATGKKAEATTLRRELLRLNHHNLAQLKRMAERDANEIIPRRDYSNVVLNLAVLDAA